MPPLLTYVLAAAVVALTVALIPLIGQLHRTAASAERFLDGAKEDLHHIQEDVRATRERLEALATGAQGTVDHLQTLARDLAALGAALRGGVEGALSGLAGIGSLVGALGSLFRRAKPAEAPPA
ncbi:MAG TPA: DUF948 domain-containing protein [Holophagaceae bacterium]|nr:DUF948 domain-containing protein [Holophagaceae bacterium]